MYKIKLLNEISSIVGETLAAPDYAVGKEMEAPEAIIVRSADMLTSELNPELLAIARAGVGYNNVPVDRCSEAGVAVFYSPGANANAVKELVMAGLMLATRDILAGIEWAKSLDGQGDKIPALVEKGKSQFVGPELSGKTLGVLGLGNIGGPVATLGTHFHMDVLGYDPYMTVDAAWSVSRAVKRSLSLEELLTQSDYLTIHVPLNAETRGQINAEFIAGMKDGAVLLNFSRGEIVQDDALLAALESGKLRGYVTDFPNQALLGKKGVICIPHLGASTPESEENCARMAADQIGDFLKYGAVRNSVNLPDCPLPPHDAYRLTVIHKNVPKMLSRITAMVGDAHVNISHMVNRSRKDVGYTVLDLDEAPPEDIVRRLEAFDEMMKVRVIS